MNFFCQEQRIIKIFKCYILRILSRRVLTKDKVIWGLAAPAAWRESLLSGPCLCLTFFVLDAFLLAPETPLSSLCSFLGSDLLAYVDPEYLITVLDRTRFT